MRLALVLAAAIAATFAVSAKADDLDAQVNATIQATKVQAVAQQKEAAAQIAQWRGPEHRRPPEHRRGRWEHGRLPRHPWRPYHYARYLGFSYSMEECRMFGREAGFPFVTRYAYSGDCYGDFRPY